MPSVKKDTTTAEGWSRVEMSVSTKGAATIGTAGKPAPKQHDTQVEHACRRAWELPPS